MDTLILVKAMGHRKRFGNPFRGSGETNLRNLRNTSNPSSQSLRGYRKKSSFVCKPVSMEANNILTEDPTEKFKEPSSSSTLPIEMENNIMKNEIKQSDIQMFLTRHRLHNLNFLLTFSEICLRKYLENRKQRKNRNFFNFYFFMSISMHKVV